MGENQLPHHSDTEIDAILEGLQNEPTPDFSADSSPILPPQQQVLPSDSPKKNKTGPIDWFREIWKAWGSSSLIAALAVFFIFGVVFRFITVEGSSMLPTLKSGDRLIMSCLFKHPDNGDIVILSDKTGLNKPLVKRVIATGGQKLDIRDGEILIDDIPLEESYIAEEWNDSGKWRYPFIVPEGTIFVMGDNRNHSEDSRFTNVGLVDTKEVLGEVIFRLFPIRSIGTVK